MNKSKKANKALLLELHNVLKAFEQIKDATIWIPDAQRKYELTPEEWEYLFDPYYEKKNLCTRITNPNDIIERIHVLLEWKR
ncbi:MAG: hypothetical protein ACREBU_00855 [Nitrososphaera sp.]